MKTQKAVITFTRVTTLIILAAAILTACATRRNPASISMHTGSDDKSENWKINMAQLADAFSQVIPHTTSDTFPDSTEARKQIIGSVKILRKLSHQINPDKTQMGSDPRFASIADQLQNDLDDGVKLLEQNKWKSGIRRVAQATQNCVACHTVQLSTAYQPVEKKMTVTDTAILETADHKKFATNDNPLNNHLGDLTPIQRGDYFVATQQFDLAIDQYESILVENQWAHSHQKEWNDIFVKLLAVTVRVKADPSLLMELVSRFIDSGTYPNNLKDTSRLWRHQAREWRAEQRAHKKENVQMAEKLLAQANKLSTPKAPYKGLLLYLRASRILNARMMNARGATATSDRVVAAKQNLTAKDYYLSGVAEEGLASAIVWTFPEAYFQKCADLKGHATAGSDPWIKRCESKLASMKDT